MPTAWQMSATVLPSIHEGFPNVVLESLASSIPVVATRVGPTGKLKQVSVRLPASTFLQASPTRSS